MTVVGRILLRSVVDGAKGRAAGERRAEVRKVELGGRELSSIGYEMAMRENFGQEAESQGGENVSSECFVESVVLSRSSTAVGRSCAVQ
jgi:hypothetical protein